MRLLREKGFEPGVGDLTVSAAIRMYAVDGKIGPVPFQHTVYIDQRYFFQPRRFGDVRFGDAHCSIPESCTDNFENL